MVVDEQIRDKVKKVYSDVIMESVSATGLGVGGALAALSAELLIIILRLINFGLINYKIKIFLSIVSWCYC